MWQAFIIVLREGVEAFLIVAITVAFLRKTLQGHLVRAAAWGIAGSVAASGLLGYFLWLSQGVNAPLWEGILGAVSVVLIATLVIHMWRMGPILKQHMEAQLQKVTDTSSGRASWIGVFFFTLVMISREGMETALLLFQVQQPQIMTGVFLGVLGAAAVAYLWQQFGYLINMKHFLRVTAVYLLLFTIQIAAQSFHEFTEVGIFPNSEALHIASEPFSTDGFYGKWYAALTALGCGLWLIASWVGERISKWKTPVAT
ncbi:MAG: hypothetical protein COV74_09340 [Candidatus Omnitrophica bacterium CG11_big_fil_rev_8_21_14_0_20_45_26]|uniref:Iron permease FTR1 n=1 Tax=Candidatus Abzuiibacterium crystallinum TaxID=1974748 RepID=A0A2H0LLP8_9BACT|nr:MAG: hypothetical protein COV74_09340 [Candidatus Omnitrophica bacterium CG11_big_fil_rev_8_21_14_0_20_45_26]PIW65356.1 MAG: hypothetical protein COW12_02280 [Candidatus Omnitrophica bacterium CG12_big_fil_rev_8_21_14_0_65_45_16]